MLPACIRKKLIFAAAAALLVFAFSGAAVLGDFIPTNRDTRLPPGIAVFQEGDVPYPYVFLGQFGDLRYHYRHDRDVILIECAQGRFTWRTGLDAPFNIDVESAIDAAQTDAELRRVAQPLQNRLNATWTALANSILTVEFFDSAYNVHRISSAASSGAESTMYQLGEGHFRLDVNFITLDLFIPVHIFLDGEGFTYHISHREMRGEGLDVLNAIILSPFMGAAGGRLAHFDFETRRHGEPEPVPMMPGYALIPDGSGGLVRFMENSVSFAPYTGRVFGIDPAEEMFFYNRQETAGVQRINPLMPVFGVAHGHDQQAFVAWATEGAEYMEIIMVPHNNTTWYNYVYPRFVVNQVIHQVYNRRGDGFFRLFPQRRMFDITMQYRFLHGEEANYAGMARAYRAHLIDEGILTPGAAADTPAMRLDFIMSDVRRSVLGRTNVVVTTAEQVGDIVRELHDSGVSSINGGLLGFQRGGITTGQPWAINFSRAIGTRGDFTALFRDMAAIGADISFAQDYYQINEHQMMLSRNQAYHRNRWGLVGMASFESFLPVNAISFARPSRSAEWLERQTTRAINIGAPSVTVLGITNNLTSHWGRNDPICAQTAVRIFQDAFADISVPINADAPNMYLWEYTDRFLNAPVFNNQNMITTDTVPFLQMVLHNTMELYAPYSNFSFYSQRDILRMIDYNVFPSFVLTHSPAHFLSNTNSFNFYSTEFAIYRDIIVNVYEQVAPVFSQVMGLEWLDRHVLAEGVVLNTYDNGVEVLINYTDNTYTHNGIGVAPQTARVFR